MKALITGGAGFLGRHLQRRLEADGAYVSIFDNYLVPVSEDDDPASGKFKKGDITKDSLPISNWDVIFHMACPASPVAYMRNSTDTIMTAIQGTHNALQHAFRCKSKFIHFSTSEVYGTQKERMDEPCKGEVDPLSPRSCYSEAKRAAETLVAAYSRQYQIETAIVRPFNVYGPGMRLDDGRVLPNFIKRALTDAPLFIYGSGQQTRCFCYIDDFIEGLVTLLDAPGIDWQRYQRPLAINIGTDDEISILDLANLVAEITESTGGVKFSELPVDDPTNRVPGLARARSILDWNPRTELREGLELMIEDFRARL